jgi:ribonuclease BN (tRNA processing enzyme)
MQCVVLGSSGTYPAADAPGSGYLVRTGEAAFLLDVGPGTFLPLAQRMDPGSLDALVISHVHPDHCSDFFAVWHHLAYGPGADHRIPVFVPDGAFDRLAAFLGVDDHSDPLYEAFDVRTVGQGTEATVAGVTLSFAAADHSVPAAAVRVDDGSARLVYTGDTGPSEAVADLAAGATVLLSEATYVGTREDHDYPYHLTAAEAGALALRAGVERLVLTHLPPHVDRRRSVAEAAATFGGPIAVARPGLEITL